MSEYPLLSALTHVIVYLWELKCVIKNSRTHIHAHMRLYTYVCLHTWGIKNQAKSQHNRITTVNSKES